jgi:hypothetical protein
MTVPITLNGTFGFKDTYDWADSHGKTIELSGLEGLHIPDSYANLVEKRGLAKSYPVSGTMRANSPTRGWCAGLCVDPWGRTLGDLWRTSPSALHGHRNKGA